MNPKYILIVYIFILNTYTACITDADCLDHIWDFVFCLLPFTSDSYLGFVLGFDNWGS